MDTGQVLDLFSLSTSAQPEADRSAKANAATSKNNVLEGLEDLPPENEYDSLDVSAFISGV